ncbi:MAG: D-glycerate dehydrogenase [Candidatus Eremiobacteraeota bacterium]|nr:D-glycerate dehydrogenase [Candidatus Eremiobacteraeota bacterium]
MNEPELVVATRVPADVLEKLRERAPVTDVAGTPRAHWDGALAAATGMLVGSAVRVDADLLDRAPKLKIVSSVSVGYDNVDTAALKVRGVAFTNTRGSLVEAVADLTFVLAVMAIRRIGLSLTWVRDGRWLKGDAPFGNDVENATLGIVGMGTIGLAVARRARAAGMHVIYNNRNRRDDDAHIGAEYRTLDELLALADCVVVLVPLGEATRGMFGDAAFAKMKPSATFVNVARGAIVDTAALLRALEMKKIAGAALDVTDPEPLPPDHPLLAREDVVVLPHVGSATFETRRRMAMLAADNLLAALDGRPLLTPVEL